MRTYMYSTRGMLTSRCRICVESIYMHRLRRLRQSKCPYRQKLI